MARYIWIGTNMVAPLVGIAVAAAARLAAKKVAQEAAKKAAKAAAAKTAKIAKNSVKVKPAAKPIPNKIDAAKIKYQRESSRARDRKQLPQDHPDRGIKLGKDKTKRVSSKVSGSGPDGFGRSPIKPSLSKTNPWRVDIPNKNAVKINSAPKPTADSARAAALRAEKNRALANSAKGKTQTPTAEAARRRNLNK